MCDWLYLFIPVSKIKESSLGMHTLTTQNKFIPNTIALFRRQNVLPRKKLPELHRLFRDYISEIQKCLLFKRFVIVCKFFSLGINITEKQQISIEYRGRLNLNLNEKNKQKISAYLICSDIIVSVTQLNIVVYYTVRFLLYAFYFLTICNC